MSILDDQTMAASPLEAPSRARRRAAFSGMAARVTTIASLVFLGVISLMAIAPWILSPGDPTTMEPTMALRRPSLTFWMGTDQYGRSILALIIHGARDAVLLGISSSLIALLIGGLIGLVGGYFGRWADMILGRLVDILMCFPGLLLALLITAALGPSYANVVAAVAVAAVPGFARVMRSQVITVRSRLFIEAARATGLPTRRIVWRYILPNAIAPVVVLATISIGVSIVIGASLSFLGVGPQSEIPDWGQLLATGQQYMGSAWWISTFPGLVLTLTVIAVSLLGDTLRDRLDVRT